MGKRGIRGRRLSKNEKNFTSRRIVDELYHTCKRFCSFYTSTYETGEKWLKKALEHGGYEVEFLPNHLANEQFPFYNGKFKRI